MKLLSNILDRVVPKPKKKVERSSVAGSWTQLTTGGIHHKIKTDVGFIFETFCGRNGSNKDNVFVWLNPNTFEGTSVKFCKTCLKASKAAK